MADLKLQTGEMIFSIHCLLRTKNLILRAEKKVDNQVKIYFLVEIKKLRRYEVPPLLRRRVGIRGAMAVGGAEADLRQ